MRDAIVDPATLLAMAVKFEIDAPRRVYVEKRGDGKWAVTCSGEVLSDDGSWEYEPMPSGRSEDFIKRTRFDLADAITRATESLRSE